MSSDSLILAGSYRTEADSVAKLTVASAPSALLSLRSTRLEQEVHVMPVTPRSSWTRSAASSPGVSVLAGCWAVVMRFPFLR